MKDKTLADKPAAATTQLVDKEKRIKLHRESPRKNYMFQFWWTESPIETLPKSARKSEHVLRLEKKIVMLSVQTIRSFNPELFGKQIGDKASVPVSSLKNI